MLQPSTLGEFMQINNRDFVVSITLVNEITPAALEALDVGEFPWQLRVEYENFIIFMAHNNIASLLKYMNVLGLQGAEIQSVSIERGSVYLEIQDALKGKTYGSRIN
jgi:hypothetical protein